MRKGVPDIPSITPDDPLFDRPPVIGPLTRPLDPDEDPEDDRADDVGEQEEGEA